MLAAEGAEARKSVPFLTVSQLAGATLIPGLDLLLNQKLNILRVPRPVERPANNGWCHYPCTHTQCVPPNYRRNVL